MADHENPLPSGDLSEIPVTVIFNNYRKHEQEVFGVYFVLHKLIIDFEAVVAKESAKDPPNKDVVALRRSETSYLFTT